MTFRDRLLQSLTQFEPVLAIPGVMVAGSQVPNLLQPDAASTLVVSQDVDLVIPVAVHAQVRDPWQSRHPVTAETLPDMPDPHRGRELVEALIARLREIS